jgi:hypothetical protein
VPSAIKPAALRILHGQPEPVEITVRQDHPFRRRDKRWDEKKQKTIQPPGCAVCGRGKMAAEHLGAPPSLNEGGSGMNRMAYQSLKKAWQTVLTDRLNESGLERGLAGVTVEGLVGFPTRTERDGGNHRWMVEKALGDALVEGGWLSSDCFFPTARYEFGGLQAVHAPGESWIRLSLFPRRDVETVAA